MTSPSNSLLANIRALEVFLRANTPAPETGNLDGRPSHNVKRSTGPGRKSVLPKRPWTDPSGSRADRKGPKPRQNVSRSAVSGRRSVPDGPAEEEAAKTKKYWARFAANTTPGLLEQVERDYRRDVIEKQLVYSARLGSKPTADRPGSPSVESVSTDLSLLTCSSGSEEEGLQESRRNRKRKKSLPKPEAGSECPNWEAIARERKGVLHRLLQREQAQFISPGLINKRRASDLMTSEENALLMDAAFSTNPEYKSHSTANLVVVPMANQSNDVADESRTSTPYLGEGKEDLEEGELPEGKGQKCRSSSLPSFENLPRHDKMESSPRKSTFSPYAPCVATSLNGPVSRRNAWNPRRASRQIQKNIDETTEALDRVSRLQQIGKMDNDYNSYNYNGHAYVQQTPRPPKLGLAPGLGGIMYSTIQSEMRRPIQKKIKFREVATLNQPLGRSHRNLVIFSWLNEVEEDLR